MLPSLTLAAPSQSMASGGEGAGAYTRFGNASLTVNSNFWLIATIIGTTLLLLRKKR